MSIHHQTIILYGWDIGYEEYRELDWDDPLREEYGWRDRQVGDVALIGDGLAGEYCYLGQVLRVSNSTKDGLQDIGCINLEELHPTGEMERAWELMEEYGFEAGSPSTHIFTHVT